MGPMPARGRSVQRREGPGKLTGRALYVDDIPIPGCLFGVTLRSTIPHGAIRAVTFDPAFPWDDFVVVTARDVPRNRVALIADDQPLLADTRVMHQMEPIALVAHRDRGAGVRGARSHHRRLRARAAGVDHRRVAGGPDAAVRARQRLQGHRESRAAISIAASPRPTSSSKAPASFHTRSTSTSSPTARCRVVRGGWASSRARCSALLRAQGAERRSGWAPTGARLQAVTGGGFGGKEEYPVLAAHVALLAAGAAAGADRLRPRRGHRRRRPSAIPRVAAPLAGGRAAAGRADIDVVMDGGAYVTLSPVVLSRGVLHAAGPYRCPSCACGPRRRHAHAAARRVPRLRRAAGAFASERQMEKLARRGARMAGTLRRGIGCVPGDPAAPPARCWGPASAPATCESPRAAHRSAAVGASKTGARARRGQPDAKGMGVRSLFHGAGFTGGERGSPAARRSAGRTRRPVRGRWRLDRHGPGRDRDLHANRGGRARACRRPGRR